ncbi:MAG: hypothetical protein WA949_20160, partial [Phormidesmis sp.]
MTTLHSLEGCCKSTMEKALKNPSGKAFRVLQISGSDGNEYSVIKASDWFDLATDVLINPGKTRKPTKQ